jgi:NADH-quinone oxidoreductase subunit N
MVFMYMKDSTEEFDWLAVSPSLALCLILSVAGVLIPGILPGTLLQLAQKALLM